MGISIVFPVRLSRTVSVSGIAPVCHAGRDVLMDSGVVRFRPPCAGRADTAQRVVVIRHGETEWSRAGRHTGRTDMPLTQAGKTAAIRLRDALRGRRFAAVFTSP